MTDRTTIKGFYAYSVQASSLTAMNTHTHTHTTILWLFEFCLGQPG